MKDTDSDSIASISVEGYIFKSFPRQSQRPGGGTGILFRDSLSVSCSLRLTLSLNLLVKIRFLFPERLSGPGSSRGQGHCVVFLSKTHCSHSASLHPGVVKGTGEFNDGELAMGYHPVKEGVQILLVGYAIETEISSGLFSLSSLPVGLAC